MLFNQPGSMTVILLLGVLSKMELTVAGQHEFGWTPHYCIQMLDMLNQE